MSRGTGPGAVVSRGTIRVDARRAVAKLREHLLLDLHLYGLEVVRAAVAFGAERIDVRYDANDVVITWAGPAPAPAVAARLLDHVLSEARSDEERQLRLLALGINAALGLSPAFVDLISAGQGPDGGCSRVRFTPELLDASQADSIEPEIVELPRPAAMPERGGSVHLRRRFGWSIVRGAALGEVPREISALVQSTEVLDRPLTLNGRPLDRSHRAPALVRVPFQIQGVRTAFLELTPPSDAGPALEFLEQGVRLARYVWSPAPELPGEAHAAVALPVRVVVDAPELPTNASRSAVREDSALFVRAFGDSVSAFESAVQTLIARLHGTGAAVPGVELRTDDGQALEQTLGACVCVAVGALHRGDPAGALARTLLELPVLRDGCGRPRSYASLRLGAEATLYVHQSAEPLEPDLGPWMHNVLWRRGTMAERALQVMDLQDAAQVARHARVAAQRRARFLAHAPTEVALAPSPSHLTRERFCVEDGAFAGLRGEVALLAPDLGSPGATVRVFVDQRPLCTESIAPGALPLGLEMALSWEGRWQVGFGYDAVAHDRAFRSAVWYAAQRGVAQARGLASRLEELAPPVRRKLRGILRAAVGTAHLSAQAFGVLEPEGTGPTEDDPLWHGRAWPTTEPERFVSLQDLAQIAARTGALCVAGPRRKGVALDGRPVVACDRTELGWLADALGAFAPTVIPYQRGVFGAASLARRPAQLRAALREAFEGESLADAGAGWLPQMAFSMQGARGLLAVAERSAVAIHHAAKRLSVERFPRCFGPVAIALDDDSIVPNADWTGVLHGGAAALEGLEQELLATVVAALGGSAAARQRLEQLPASAIDGGRALRGYLLESALSLRQRVELLGASVAMGKRFAAEEHDDETAAGAAPDRHEAELGVLADLLDELHAVPLLEMLDEMGQARPATLAAVLGAHDGEIPVLSRTPGFETLSWQPLLIPDPREAEAFGRWAPAGAHAVGAPELGRHQELAERDRAKRALMRKPLATIEGLEEHTPAAAVALADRSGVEPHAELEILYRLRPVCHHVVHSPPLPLSGHVNLVDPADLEEWIALSEQGTTQVLALVIAAARTLAHSILESARDLEGQGPEAGEVLFEDPRALALLAGLLRDGRDQTARQEAALLRAAIRDPKLHWPTVQGEACWVSRLLRGGASSEPVIYAARQRYGPWRRARRGKSELDEPVLYLPATSVGEQLLAILAALDHPVQDVSSAVAALQARRSQCAAQQTPRLPGTPSHPALRVSLASLRVASCEGELQITAGPESKIVLTDLEGPARSLRPQLPVPIVAVAQVDTIATERTAKLITRHLKRAAVRLLRKLSGELDQLPDYVRPHYRRALCAKLPHRGNAKARLGKDDRAAKIFLDTTGRWWSLNELLAEQAEGQLKCWWLTLAPPPYPARAYPQPILRFDEAEDLEGLRQLIPLRNRTKFLQKDLEGERRVQAAPCERVELSDELRQGCLQVIEIEHQGMKGQLGILVPGRAPNRGLRIHTGRRPLCTLHDGPGWPLCGAINDDALRPNRAHDALASRKQAESLRSEVRALADEALQRWFQPPADALASTWIDTSRETDAEPTEAETTGASSHSPPLLLGRLWLPARWPQAPDIRLHTASTPLGEPLPLRQIERPAALDGRLPVAGSLLVLSGAADSTDVHHALVETARAAVERMVEQAGDRPESSAAELERYRWDLWLCAPLPGTPPDAVAGDGSPVGPPQVLDELRRHGCLWFSSQRGSTLGAFPGARPSFILPAESPLVDVLRHRSLPGVLRELGGLAEPPPPVDPNRAALDSPSPAPSSQAPPQAARSPDAPSPGPSAPALPDPSWFDGLLERVGAWWSRSEAQPVIAQGEQLASAMLDALRRLGLTGEPVDTVAYARSGRPLRYEPAARRIWLNVTHPAVRALAGSPPEPAALSLLVAAAVTEVNRALESVTDLEECRALLDLLATKPSAS